MGPEIGKEQIRMDVPGMGFKLWEKLAGKGKGRGYKLKARNRFFMSNYYISENFHEICITFEFRISKYLFS